MLNDPVNLVDPWGLAGKGPSIFDVIFPDTLNSGEDEELAKIRDNARRWRYDNGKFQPIDPKTGKPYKPDIRCEIKVPDFERDRQLLNQELKRFAKDHRLNHRGNRLDRILDIIDFFRDLF